MPRILPILIGIALIVYAFMDCAQTDSTAMPAKISKSLWLLLIVLVPVLGALIWLFFKYQHIFKSDYTMGSFGAGQSPFSRPKKPSGPLAPDDDPDFLARLEARNRRRAYEERMRQEGRLPEDGKQDQDEDDDSAGGLYGSR